MAFQMAVILSYFDLLYLWAGLSVGARSGAGSEWLEQVFQFAALL